METGMDAYLCRLDQEEAERQRPEEEEDGSKEQYCFYCGKTHSKEEGCRFADVNL